MTFEEYLRQDLETFINVDEFGELAEIDGRKIKAIISRNSAASATSYSVKRQVVPQKHIKLSGQFLQIFCKAKELPPKRNGDFITVNGARYKVSSVAELHGILKIICTNDTDLGIRF